MSDDGRALDALMDDAVEFFASHEALNSGAYYDSGMREGVRGIMLATLAYLSTQARKAGIEDELNAILYRISQGDGRR